jgi:hypothetical protein
LPLAIASSAHAAGQAAATPQTRAMSIIATNSGMPNL